MSFITPKCTFLLVVRSGTLAVFIRSPPFSSRHEVINSSLLQLLPGSSFCSNLDRLFLPLATYILSMVVIPDVLLCPFLSIAVF